MSECSYDWVHGALVTYNIQREDVESEGFKILIKYKVEYVKVSVIRKVIE